MTARLSLAQNSEEQRLCAEIVSLEEAKPERILDAVRILELAHKAHFLYLQQTPEEQAEFPKLVVSNCSIDAVNVYPTYRKPFDLIFATSQNEGWRARRDSNSRPSGSKEWRVKSKSRLRRRIPGRRFASCVPTLFQHIEAISSLCQPPDSSARCPHPFPLVRRLRQPC
jgi:hypothetical protein